MSRMLFSYKDKGFALVAVEVSSCSISFFTELYETIIANFAETHQTAID